jgi:DNA-binding Lrp family transcriptional regulator
MRAYILLKIHTGEIGEALAQMRQVPGLVQADMTFGPYDAVATVEAQDLRSVGNIVAWQIQTIPGVAETLTCLAVELDGRGA